MKTTGTMIIREIDLEHRVFLPLPKLGEQWMASFEYASDAVEYCRQKGYDIHPDSTTPPPPTRITRTTPLTPEEAAKYNEIRKAIEAELPELIERHHARVAMKEKLETRAASEQRIQPGVTAPLAGVCFNPKTNRLHQFVVFTPEPAIAGIANNVHVYGFGWIQPQVFAKQFDVVTSVAVGAISTNSVSQEKSEKP